MKKLFIEFTNGDFYIGTFYLYKSGNKEFKNPNWKCDTSENAMYFIPECYWIHHETSDELHTISSIVKIKDMTEEELLSYSRNKQLNKILYKFIQKSVRFSVILIIHSPRYSLTSLPPLSTH